MSAKLLKGSFDVRGGHAPEDDDGSTVFELVDSEGEYEIRPPLGSRFEAYLWEALQSGRKVWITVEVLP